MSKRNSKIYDKVAKRFSKFPNVNVVNGIVPDNFEKACPEKISLLHIDMNSSKSEIAALEHLFDRVSPGGIIVFDDFGWLGYDRQTFVEIQWMAQRGHSIMELPTGQGLVLKH
jgi:O-methyltransferase